MAIHYPPTQNGLQKTLDANLLTGVTASATLNNVTGIQNKLGLFVVDRVDGNNNLTPNKREYISFAGTSGSTVVTLTRGLAGSTDQDHAVGAIVEFINDVVQQQAIIDYIEALNTTVSALPTANSTTTFTNKRNQFRIESQATTDTITPEISTYDLFIRTAQAHDLVINNHSTSTPEEGEMMMFELTCDGTNRAITYGDAYVAKSGTALPSTLTASKMTKLLFIWVAAISKWDLLDAKQEA